MKYNNIYRNMTRLAAIALSAGIMTACGDEEIDNSFSRNNAVMQMTTSSDYIVLDEANPDAVVLTVEWDNAYPYGNEFITTYQYQIDAVGSKASAKKEYEDDNVFRREYTNAQLQELLVGHFGCLTSSFSTLNLTVTASFEGPRVVLPDISTASVNIKTYGPKQYLADRLFIGGEAIGGDEIELTPTSATSGIYKWTGALASGKINFPVIYGDEHNAISPDKADAPITEEDMPAVMVDASEANSWIIPAADNYRITININNRTVNIVPAGAIIEMDRLFMAGAAVGDEPIEITRTLEAEDLYAWRGELKAGKLYMPVEFEEKTVNSLVPKAQGDRDIHDGEAHAFNVVPTDNGTLAAYWDIPADGTYRIVVNTTDHKVTIYSAATDLKNTVVEYKNTVIGDNNFKQEVTELWMWGGFNDNGRDAGLPAGFQSKYVLKQSLANPNVFVYYGSALPRGKATTEDYNKNPQAGAVKFLVTNINNNVYCYGSTADAVRNVKVGYVTPTVGVEETVVSGQGDNRYAYFIIPEKCNYVCVDIEKLTVVFDIK